MAIKNNKTIANFLNLMRPYSRSVLFLSISIIFLEGIKLLGPYILKELIDGLLDFSVNKINWFIFLVAAFFVSILVVSVINYFKDKKIFGLLIQAEYDLPIRCQKKLLSLDFLYHQEEGTGDKITKIDKGVYKFTDFLGTIFWELLPVLFQLISTTIILILIDYRLAVILLFFSAILLFLNIRVNKKVYPNRKIRYKKYEEASGKMVQSIININTVQSFSQEKREVEELSKIKKEIFFNEKKNGGIFLSLLILEKF